jgi:hypothetical protein
VNPFIIGAIIVQIVIARISRIAGALAGFLITTGILIWGLSVYEHHGYHIVFFFIPLSKLFFIIICLAWYVFNTVEFVNAIRSADFKLSVFRRLLSGKIAPKKKMIVVDKDIDLYRVPNLDSKVQEKLYPGFEIKNIGFTIQDESGLTWRKVSLFDGKKGYVHEFARMARMLNAKTVSPNIEVFETSVKNPAQIACLQAGSVLEICDKEWGKNDHGVTQRLVLLPDGRLGYIDQNQKFDWI